MCMERIRFHRDLLCFGVAPWGERLGSFASRAVYALYVFHHIPQTADLVAQLSRKSKRVLIFEDLPRVSPSPLVAALTFGLHFLLFHQSVHTDLHHSRPEWRRLLEDEWGFRVLREYRIPPTAALPYERVAFYAEVAEPAEE